MKTHFSLNMVEAAANDYDEALGYFMEHAFEPLTNPYNFNIGPYPDEFVKPYCQNVIQ